MKKISFLFGAGAEGIENYELPSGSEYIRSIIRLQEELKTILSDVFVEEYYKMFDLKKGYLYRKDTVDFIKKIKKRMIKNKAIQDDEYFKKYENEIRNQFSKSEYDELKSSKRATFHNEEVIKVPCMTSDDGVDEFRDILLQPVCLKENIKSDFYRELFEENEKGEIIFDYKPVISNMLDSYFHSIINPTKYGVGKFSKIFVYYWSCYFAIVEPILKLLIKNQYLEFEQYYVNGKCHYRNIIENIDEFTKKLYEIDKIETERKSYYSYIQELLDRHAAKYICRGVLTTNYFNFCQHISCQEIAYLNGELKYFEYPEILDVADLSIEQKQEHKIFFPFIFGPSHVKPIVHGLQTDSYTTMKNILKKTDILIILGYGIGEDDNHINAFLHEFLTREGKKIIYVTENEERKEIAQKLRVEECFYNQIECIRVKYNSLNNQTVINEIFNKLEEEI